MNRPDPVMYAGIEAGGTKFVVGIGPDPRELRSWTEIKTGKPEPTLAAVIEWLETAEEEHGPIAALGIGSFGPVDLRRESPNYGHITTTPKPGWQNVDLVGTMRAAFPVPVGFDTDVNAAALGEHLYGAGVGRDPLVYITVGTGIGGGAIVNGQPLHGLVHPEMGHLHVPPPVGTTAPVPECQCPYHRSCLEGFASGRSIGKRWGVEKAAELPPDAPAWAEAAEILAHGLVNIIVTLSPQRIILGGGVMKQAGLIEAVRGHVQRILNGYVNAAEIVGDIDSYVVAPGLGDGSGLTGALALAVREIGSLR